MQFDIGPDYNRMLRCVDMVNRYGLDALTFVWQMNFALDLYENRIITKADTDGLELKRDFDTVIRFMEDLAHRRGFGQTLADGWKKAIDKIGKGAEDHIVLIKGQEPAYGDPRINFCSETFESIVNPRGPDVVQAESPTVIPLRTSDKIWRQCDTIGIPEETKDRMFDTTTGFKVSILTRYCEDWYHLLNVLGLCARQQITMNYDIDILSQLYTAATGIPATKEDLLKAGERVKNMEKAVNVREGFSRKDDKFPDKWFDPLKGQGKEKTLMDYYRTMNLRRDDIEKMLDEYYEERGWDVKKGIPTKGKLVELGLEDVAEDLERRGFL